MTTPAARPSTPREVAAQLIAEARPGDPGIEGRGTLRQGYLEESSVNVVAEITNLIEAQRSYEMNSKVITAVDEMMETTSRIR